MRRKTKRSRGGCLFAILILLAVGGAGSLFGNNTRSTRASYPTSFSNSVGGYIDATKTPKPTATPKKTPTPRNTVSSKGTEAPKPTTTQVSSAVTSNTFTFSSSNHTSAAPNYDKSLSYSGTFNNKNQPQNGMVTYKSNGAVVERKIANGKLSDSIVIKAGSTVITSTLSAKDSTDSIEEVTITYANGDVYTGSLVNGKKAGRGTYRWKNGAWYTGEWANDTMHGNGTYYFTTSTKKQYLTGKFYNGSPSGTLIYASEKGILYNSFWSKGECISIGRK